MKITLPTKNPVSPFRKIFLLFLLLCACSLGVYGAIVCTGWKSTSTATFTQLITFVSTTTGCEHSYLLMLPDEVEVDPI